MNNTKIFIVGRIVTFDEVLPENGYVEIQSTKITAVNYRGEPEVNQGDKIYFFKDSYLCPGFVDIHVHGSGGADTMDASPEALDTISLALARGGTTAFLATTMSAPHQELLRVIRNITAHHRNVRGATVLGLHLEGPYLNPELKGAHKYENIRKPNLGELKEYVETAEGLLKLITVAPELTGAIELIGYAKSQGIVTSLGHSNASYEQVEKSYEAGLSHVTHIFNAMGGLHHREPGAVGAALGLENLSVEVIPDAIHVNPLVVNIIIKTKGIEQVCSVTDCIRAGILGDGSYELGGQKVIVKNGIAMLDDGTIAGSVISMSQGVRNLVNRVGLPLHDAVRMCTVNPARLLGQKTKGTLDKGIDADVTVLSQDLEVLMTVVEGRVVFLNR